MKTDVVVHIGMSKCMSTTLQNLWFLDDHYAFGSLDEQNTRVEDLIIENNGNRREVGRLLGLPNTDISVKEGRPNVFSSEGILNAFNGRPQVARFNSVKQELFAEIFSAQAPRLLIMVRDPLDWLRSIYAQYIREGGADDFSTYVGKNAPFLKETLNLQKIIKIWASHGYRVVVLPLELSEDWEGFWGLYERYLKVPRPASYRDKLPDVLQNRTNYDRLSVHKAINRLVGLLVEGAGSNPITKHEMLDSMERFRLFGTRAGVDNLSDDLFGALTGCLHPDGLQDNDQLFDRRLVMKLFGTHIDKNFVPAAREFSPHECGPIISNYSPG